MTTNRERINAMSNEELAEILAMTASTKCCEYCALQKVDCYKENDYICKDGVYKQVNINFYIKIYKSIWRRCFIQ